MTLKIVLQLSLLLTLVLSACSLDPFMTKSEFIVFSSTMSRAANPVDGSNVFVMPLSGSSIRQVTGTQKDQSAFDGGTHYVACSPNGERLAFSAGNVVNEGIYLIDTDGQNLLPLIKPSIWTVVEGIDWSPNDQQIAFGYTESDGKIDNEHVSIKVKIVENKLFQDNTHQLGSEFKRGGNPSWSPDGDRITFSMNGDIFLMNADGSNLINLTNDSLSDNSQPSWSPDGHRIAFVSRKTGNSEILVMNIDGTDIRNLTNNPSDDFAPRWSPEGRQIVFVSNRDYGPFPLTPYYVQMPADQIYVMNSDGSGQHNIINNKAWNSNPQWCMTESVDPIKILLFVAGVLGFILLIYFLIRHGIFSNRIVLAKNLICRDRLRNTEILEVVNIPKLVPPESGKIRR